MTTSTAWAEWEPPSRCGRAHILFETAHPNADPEGLISKFVAFESYRMKRETHALDMLGSLQERLGVLIWYLTDYIRDRQSAFVIPLSAKQIAYLNSPLPLAGASPAVTVALYNVVARELPTHLDLRDPTLLREALYWWCVERAPAAKLECSLVTDDQVAILRAEDRWPGEDYPLNAFMTLFLARHPELHSIDIGMPRDRAAFFHYLVLYGFTRPHLLRLLPLDALRRVLRETASGAPLFDQALALLAGAGGSSADEGELRRIGLALLGHDGWVLDGRRMMRRDRDHRTGDTGQCFDRVRDLGARVAGGLALIGPVAKASGLGQAARLSLAVLRRAEAIEPTVLDFGLDNPAPVGFAAPTTVQPYDKRRAVNLIHLNAESVPLVFAFEQEDIFATSYNVGYFFWELDAIPKCHGLALELLDEIWVASEYNREIYCRVTDKPVINVGMAVEPLPSLASVDRGAFGLARDSFVFLATFDSFSFIERKNPLGVVEAFKEAFPLGTERVQLVLKTQNRRRVFDAHQIALWNRIDRAARKDQRIVVINETLDYRDLLGLKSACDCYVSLHRSEGWGFGMIEAMQLGMPVIATAYSGNMEFCNAETAFLVGYDLVCVRDEEYIFVERDSRWAQPRLAEAAAHMREAASDSGQARDKGQAAAAFVKTYFGVDAIAQRYAARLRQIREGLPRLD